MIDPELAIEIARMKAKENGWKFGEPVKVVHRRGWFGRPGRLKIETLAGKLGSKARFVINASTGEIISEEYLAMIDPEVAIEIARKRAEENGWAFGKSVGIEHHRGRDGSHRYEIVTDPAMRGTKSRFEINAVTGEIISEGYIPY